MSYLAKVKDITVAKTLVLSSGNYRSKFDEGWICPTGVIVEDDKVGAVLIPTHMLEMAILCDGWKEEIDPDNKIKVESPKPEPKPELKAKPPKPEPPKVEPPKPEPASVWGGLTPKRKRGRPKKATKE